MNGVGLTVGEAVSKALSAKRNTYIINDILTPSKISQLAVAMHRINTRIRFCLSNCILTSEAIDSLNDILSEANDFEVLIFQTVEIQNFQLLCEGIKTCSSLSILTFRNCHLASSSIEFLIQTFGFLPHLQTFEISLDRIGPSLFNDICHSLCQCKELTTFRWMENQLGDPSSFVDLFKSVKNLSYLNFSGINLNNQWKTTLKTLLDESWQIHDLQIINFDQDLAEKIQKIKQEQKCFVMVLFQECQNLLLSILIMFLLI